MKRLSERLRRGLTRAGADGAMVWSAPRLRPRRMACRLDMNSSGFRVVAAPDARLLILGTLPGAVSLAKRQYYAQPRNAFWPIIAAVAGVDPHLPYQERLRRLIAKRYALWDVCAHARVQRRVSSGTGDRPIMWGCGRRRPARQWAAAAEANTLVVEPANWWGKLFAVHFVSVRVRSFAWRVVRRLGVKAAGHPSCCP